MVLPPGNRVDNALVNSPDPAPRSAHVCGMAEGGIPIFINVMAVLGSKNVSYQSAHIIALFQTAFTSNAFAREMETLL
jgi:hypothetical protein